MVFTFLLFLALGNMGNAQSFCGTVTDEATIQRLKENIRNADLNVTRSGVTFVPITFHLIAEDDGTGRITEERVLENFCKLNADFAPYNMQFYIPNGFNYVDNSALYTASGSNSEVLSILVDNTMNVLIGNTTGDGGCFGVLGFYSPSQDIIFMTSCTVNSSSFALSHEVGHFFSLPHTFLGWENTNYNVGEPAPPTINWANVENVARSGPDANCNNSGDFFCGTNPDYNFGLTWNGEMCNYTANALDPLGVPVDPDEDNFMGYFFDCDSHQFSNDQVATIFADYANRTFINGNPGGDISSDAILQSPVNTTVNFNSVEFHWAPVVNATEYIIEVNRTPFFNATFIVDYAVVNATNFTSNQLADNQTYYWRVKPQNNYDFCQDFSEGATFMTGMVTNVENPGLVESFLVYPNPTSGYAEISLDIHLNDYFEGEVFISDIHGKQVYLQKLMLNAGFNAHKLPVTNLPEGIYIVAVRGVNDVYYQSLIVTNK